MPAHTQDHREGSRTAHAERKTARRSCARLLALAAGALLLLALAVVNLGAPPRVQGHALVPNGTPSTSPSPAATTTTPTATATAGTITLVSPSYGSGPTGARVTVAGSGFSGGSLTLKAAAHADCSSPQATLTSFSSASGSFTQTFTWPSTLPDGTYYICASGATSGPSYQQLSTSAPAISLSAPSVAQGGQLVISGSNFAGLPAGSNIMLTATQGNAQSNIGTALVDASGQFSQNWTVDVSFTGTVVIGAQSQPEGTAPSVLQASASVTITPPATATASATASATATSSAGGISPSTQTGSNGGGGGLVLVIVLLLVVLLVGGGATAYLLLRRRGTGGPQAPYPPGGGYPGYSPYGPSSPGWDANTERMSGMWSSGQYGAGTPGPGTGTGAYGVPGGYGASGVGAVSQWDEPPEEYGDEPSAGWQPRPMTGYGNFTLPQEAPQGGGYAPADPWGDASAGGGGYGSYGGNAGSYGGNAGSYGGNAGSYGGNAGSYGSGGYARDDDNWRNQAGGQGATRPGGDPQQRYPRQPSQGYGQGQGFGQAPGGGWPDEAPGGGRPPEDWRQ